jgi:hypothetical protein
MWTYKQSNGELLGQHDLNGSGHYVNFGWAGQREGKNNPAMQNVHNIGPLPVGTYTISEAP